MGRTPRASLTVVGLLVLTLIAALVVQALTDSRVAAWIALATTVTVVLTRLALELSRTFKR